MSLEKKVVVDLIEVVENGVVQVRTKTSILEDGVQISSTYHRHSLEPGDDYSGQDDRVKAICQSVHTPQLIAEYKAKAQEEMRKMGALNDNAV